MVAPSLRGLGQLGKRVLGVLNPVCEFEQSEHQTANIPTCEYAVPVLLHEGDKGERLGAVGKITPEPFSTCGAGS